MEGGAHSSQIGPLVEEAQQLLGSFPGWLTKRVEAAATEEAEALARDALWPAKPSCSHASRGGSHSQVESCLIRSLTSMHANAPLTPRCLIVSAD